MKLLPHQGLGQDSAKLQKKILWEVNIMHDKFLKKFWGEEGILEISLPPSCPISSIDSVYIP